MTTTTPCFNHPDTEATTAVRANHFDPDERSWSRLVTTCLCDECVVEYQTDELVALQEVNSL